MLGDFKEISELKIYKKDQFAGILKRTETGCIFQLDSLFVSTNKSPFFSYRIKNDESPLVINGDNLPPFFAGLLPEGRRFNALVNQLKTSEDDLFSLFAVVGSDCIGDINTEKFSSKPYNIPQLKDINFYEYFNEMLAEQGSALSSPALAGVQEKISASMINIPIYTAKKEQSYILKLNPSDKDNLIQNEWHCLELAKKCNFNVNKAKIIQDKDLNKGLLVTRFDRADNKKIHQEDGCQFLNRYPADKYRITINQIADAFLELTNAPQIEILNLLCHYVFSYLICNGDMHAKNISLHTLGDGTITLTPLYDLICTALYGDYKMALKIDGRDDNIKRTTIINFAQRYHINPKAVHSVIDKILNKFIKNYSLLFCIDMDSRKKNLLQKMIEKRINDFIS